MEDLSQLDAFDACETTSTLFTLHELEQSVQRELLSQPGLDFSSLVVRRIPGGVCLEGVLEATDEADDVASLVQRVAGVDQVLNHLVIRRPRRSKG